MSECFLGLCKPVANPPPRPQDKILYILIDSSVSVTFNQFCRLGTAAQLLIAAINPRSNTSGTKFSARVFSASDIVPKEVFNTSDDCQNIVSTRIPSVINDFRNCKAENSPSTMYPPLCGDATYAIQGMNQVAQDAGTRGNQPKALILLTDGIISTRANDNEDEETGRTNLMNANISLNNANVTVRIAAQVGESGLNPTLLNYTSKDSNALINYEPVALTLDIVNRLIAENFVSTEDGKFSH